MSEPKKNKTTGAPSSSAKKAGPPISVYQEADIDPLLSNCMKDKKWRLCVAFRTIGDNIVYSQAQRSRNRRPKRRGGVEAPKGNGRGRSKTPKSDTTVVKAKSPGKASSRSQSRASRSASRPPPGAKVAKPAIPKQLNSMSASNVQKQADRVHAPGQARKNDTPETFSKRVFGRPVSALLPKEQEIVSKAITRRDREMADRKNNEKHKQAGVLVSQASTEVSM